MIYELRVYRALPGRMPNLLARSELTILFPSLKDTVSA